MKLYHFVILSIAILLPAKLKIPTHEVGQETLTSQQQQLVDYIKANYNKREVTIPMRDGIKLFTSIYEPKDGSQKYPILLDRTPYTVAPYGAGKYKTSLGPDELFAQEGYIFVYQD